MDDTDSDNATCETCRHFIQGKPDPTSIGNRISMCRRYPPQLMWIPLRPGEGMQQWVWPIVGKSDGCGEWSLHAKAKN